MPAKKGKSVMNDRRPFTLLVLSLAAGALLANAAAAQVPDAIAAPGETVVATFHAEGAQVYDCKADASGKLAWQLREPFSLRLSCFFLMSPRQVWTRKASNGWERRLRSYMMPAAQS